MTRSRIVLTVLLATPAIASMQSPPTSGLSLTRTDYRVGVNPRSVGVADFDGDGRLDVSVQNENDLNGSILLGNGDGTFQPQRVYNLPGQRLVVGDFDGDGRPDIAVGHYWAFRMYIGLGNGDGTIGPTRTEAVLPGAPQSIVAGDFNRDGKLDMVVGCGLGTWNPDVISVLLGNGDGTFQPHVDYATGPLPFSMTADDFNGDGNLDVAVAEFGEYRPGGPNAVSVHLGNGDGTLRAKIGVATGHPDPQAIASADLDGDGNGDLVVGYEGDSAGISILLGNGNGTFELSGHYGPLPTPASISHQQTITEALAVGDMNGDGKLDVAFANFNTSVMSIVLGAGDGSFGARTDFATGLNPSNIAVDDFDGNNRMDLAVANLNAATVSVFGNFPSDTTPPVIAVPGDIEVEATGPHGAVATWDPPTATDDTDGDAAVTCSATPGSMFPVAVTTVTCRAADAEGNVAEASFTVTVRDTTSPVVSCGSADGLWHGSDVAIGCSASDSGTGLADPADATFTLSTAVAVGTETVDAATGSRGVCDLSRNCATAGPLAGNKVDRKAPAIAISIPVTGTVVLHQAIAAAYSCSDTGSGVGSCVGTAANGSNIDTATPGSKTFSVTSGDQVGNQDVQSVTYSVAYNIGVLYDQGKAKISGSTIPIKIQVLDAASVNVSDLSLTVTAVGLSLVSTTALGPVDDSGDANPDGNFRFDGGSYVFNLKTTGLGTGTYALSFRCGADPTMHSVQFQIK